MFDIQPSPNPPKYAFDKYDEVVIDGISYRPESRREEGYIFVRTDRTGVAESFTHAHLHHLIEKGVLTHNRDAFLPETARRRLSDTTALISTLSGAKAARLLFRASFVEAFLDLEAEGAIKRTDETIKAARSELQDRAQEIRSGQRLGSHHAGAEMVVLKAPSPRSLRRWLREYEQDGYAGLSDRREESGYHEPRMGGDAIALMWKVVRTYASPQKPTKEKVFEDVGIAFDEANEERAAEGRPLLVMPSRETVRRAINNLDPFLVVVERDGVEAARRKFAPVGPGLDLTRPLQRVEMDEYRIDLITLMRAAGVLHNVSEEDKLALGLNGKKKRWWVTIAICATTRCIVGMRLSRSPSANSAIRTFEMILRDKGVWADAAGALSPWNTFGLPEELVTDCGPGLASLEMRVAMQDLGIRFERAPAGIPEMRARIERLFRTLGSGLLPRLTGRTFSNAIERGDYDSKGRAALMAEDICFALTRWVVDIYHNTPHEGLNGQTPAQCWNALVDKYGVAAPPNMQKQRLVFGTRMMQTLDKTGIKILGIRYNVPQLAERYKHLFGTRVPVRWYSENIGAVAVELDGVWQEIPAVFDCYEGVKAHTWQAAARMLRGASKAQHALNRSVITKAIKDIEAMNAEAMRRIGLVVEDWTEDRLKDLEADLFIGFSASDDEPELESDGASAGGLWGLELATSAGASALAQGAQESFSTEPASALGGSTQGLEVRRMLPPWAADPDAEDDWQFEKN